MRHDVMCAAGIIPLHFSPRQIRREPAEVVRLIRDALERGLQRPPLPIRTISCPESPPGRGTRPGVPGSQQHECGSVMGRAVFDKFRKNLASSARRLVIEAAFSA
jgi:hypothetical protein